MSKQHSITEPVLLDDLGNQTCPPVTNLHQDGDITIDIGNECTVRHGTVCNIQPNLACITPNVVSIVEVRMKIINCIIILFLNYRMQTKF